MKPTKFKGRSVRVNPDSQPETDKLKAALQHAVAASQHYNLPTTTTVDEGLNHWLALHSIGNKPRSVDFNKELVAFIRKTWASVLKRSVGEISETECVKYAESISHYSSSRYNGCIHALRAVIPAARILPRKSPPTPDRAGNKIPSPEEFDRLLAALDSAYSGRAGLIVRLLAHTGLRINEARKLQWTDVREDHIYARGETTKNGKPRTIPFISGTRVVLRMLKKVSRGESVLPQAECKTALRYASALTGLPRYSHHTFRHYFATRCIVSGVDIPTVAKWLGHTDGGVVLLKTYCHLLDEHSVAMAERVKLGGNLVNPETLVSLHAQSVTHRSQMIAGQSQNKIVQVMFPEPENDLAEGGAR